MSPAIPSTEQSQGGCDLSSRVQVRWAFRGSQTLKHQTRSIPHEDSAKYRQTQLWASLRASWVGDWTRRARRCRLEVASWAKQEKLQAPEVVQVRRAIATLNSQIAREGAFQNDTESPIFVLSTAWRSGSTLLQRILLTDPHLLLWGEPLGEMGVVSRLTGMLADFISPLNLDLWTNQVAPTSGLSTTWIANLYPPALNFRLSLRSLFDQWLGAPAREKGFGRWGFKEVRIGASEALLLHWVYPNSKFVFLSRHPYDSYRSLADSEWQGVYDRYPEEPVNTAACFARRWNRLAATWRELPADFPSVHIKYEDLVGRKVDFRKLEKWLELKITESDALSASVGGTAVRSRLNWYERMIIASEAAPGMAALGYRSK